MKIRVSISRIGIMFSVWLLLLVTLLTALSVIRNHNTPMSADSYFLTNFLKTSHKQLQDQAQAGTMIKQFEEWRRGGILHYRLKTNVLTIGDIGELSFLNEKVGPNIELAEAMIKNEPRILMISQLVLPNKNTLIYGFDYTDHYHAEKMVFWVQLTLFITLGSGAIGGLIASAYVLRRIRSINDLCEDVIDGGNLDQRIPIRGQEKEFDSLAMHLNRMLSQISDTVTAVKSVSDNIAHDLRTPLTRVRNLLEDTRDQAQEPETQRALDKATDEVDHLLTVFNAALNIAALEAGKPHSSEVFYLDEMLSSVLEIYGPLAEVEGQELKLYAKPVKLNGNANLIFQCVTNLLENAFKYASRGQLIEISVSEEKDHALLQIRDYGPGLPDEELDHITRRFYRSENGHNKSGTGLGLSLVQAIVTAHQGILTIENAKPGLQITVRLPLEGIIRKVPDDSNRGRRATDKKIVDTRQKEPTEP